LAPEPELRFVDEVGAKDGDVRPELREHGPADTQGLNRLLVGAGQKVFVVRGGKPEDIAEKMRKSELHGGEPFDITLASPFDIRQRSAGYADDLNAQRHTATKQTASLACLAGMPREGKGTPNHFQPDHAG
jgi:hypothetical protein